jgi:hypothetical protein
MDSEEKLYMRFGLHMDGSGMVWCPIARFYTGCGVHSSEVSEIM